MKSPNWTKMEIEYLKDNHKKMFYADIAKTLKRPVSGVEHKASRLGLNKIKLSEEDKKQSLVDKKVYKATWFQDNKDRIREVRRQKPTSFEKARHYHLKSTYGITSEDYEKLLKKQNYRCAICDQIHEDAKGSCGGRLLVDHDHITLAVRGLLCFKCNTGLGHFKDNLDLLRLATKYMENYHGKRD